MLATTVAKIQERSPLKYNFARKLASLDPRVMVSNPDQAIKIFQEVLQRLIEMKWKTSEEADTVLAEYRKLVSDAKRYHLDKFSSFKITTDRLDSFLFEVLQNQNESQSLWITMQLILTLSHGQATVERGFSMNKEVLAPNLQETSLVARLVHSSMQAAKCKVADFVVYCHHVHMLEIDTGCISWKGKQDKKELKRDRKGKLSWKN